MYKEQQINTYSEYFDFVNNLDEEKCWIFRGQRMDWNLEPLLFRVNLKGELFDVERSIVEEFITKATALKIDTKLKPLELLSIANHYGLPTRLLDWTLNSHFALWFCVKSPQEYFGMDNGNDFGVIWVLGYDKNDNQIIVDPEKYQAFTKEKKIRIYKPRHLTDRISKQEGCFTLPIFNKDDEFIPLNIHLKHSYSLYKLKIPAEIFSTMRGLLISQGTTEGSLFPDADGLCRSILMKYTEQRDERRDIDSIKKRLRNL